jgi:preprotein translocase subunit SecE
MSNQNIKRTVIVLILVLFIVINFYLIKGGLEDAPQLFLTG